VLGAEVYYKNFYQIKIDIIKNYKGNYYLTTPRLFRQWYAPPELLTRVELTHNLTSL